jgi:hypothetical protein
MDAQKRPVAVNFLNSALASTGLTVDRLAVHYAQCLDGDGDKFSSRALLCYGVCYRAHGGARTVIEAGITSRNAYGCAGPQCAARLQTHYGVSSTADLEERVPPPLPRKPVGGGGSTHAREKPPIGSFCPPFCPR